MELEDYESKSFFTPFELEHILQIPMSDIVEIFSTVPKVTEPRGCFEGEACREMIRKWARKRVYADIIARNAVNASPELRRDPDEATADRIGILDVTNNRKFTVRFPGDLRLYLTSRSDSATSEVAADFDTSF